MFKVNSSKNLSKRCSNKKSKNNLLKDLDLDNITFNSTSTDFKHEEFDSKIHSMNTSQYINTKFNHLKT